MIPLAPLPASFYEKTSNNYFSPMLMLGLGFYPFFYPERESALLGHEEDPAAGIGCYAGRLAGLSDVE